MGDNLEIDLQIGFVNKEFKEATQEAGGYLSGTTVARHSQMVWIKKEFKMAFHKQSGKRTKMREKLTNSKTSNINNLAGELRRWTISPGPKRFLSEYCEYI